jgi:hypothetical protein
MTGHRAYRRHLEALARAHGGTLRRGGRHYRIELPGGRVVPASITPSRLFGGRPVLVERELKRAMAGRTG